MGRANLQLKSNHITMCSNIADLYKTYTHSQTRVQALYCTLILLYCGICFWLISNDSGFYCSFLMRVIMAAEAATCRVGAPQWFFCDPWSATMFHSRLNRIHLWSSCVSSEQRLRFSVFAPIGSRVPWGSRGLMAQC